MRERGRRGQRGCCLRLGGNLRAPRPRRSAWQGARAPPCAVGPPELSLTLKRPLWPPGRSHGLASAPPSHSSFPRAPRSRLGWYPDVVRSRETHLHAAGNLVSAVCCPGRLTQPDVKGACHQACRSGERLAESPRQAPGGCRRFVNVANPGSRGRREGRPAGLRTGLLRKDARETRLLTGAGLTPGAHAQSWQRAS